ncbi:DUF3568 family protein [Paludisphaera mucosa]|uniref:DUF3568 family protein n=1 Tax=Paludisphaera mucosa TaxID=3030827 RepID=A0ABT6FJK1_9BACT|nr:DUF3568 family protein [Paludisphaera mucosa]MDG3007714.1 DUF3568 family protein [Paludisphaera mucosa]
MSRLVPSIITLVALSTLGCRSIGRFPGIDPTDYAYSYFNGKVTQVYQFTVPQVESSALEALVDMGFRKIDGSREDGDVVIYAKTLDHRPACVTIRRRNAMSVLSVRIGLEGDEMVSEAFIQRVALNLGTIPRTILPLEPTLRRRSDPPMPPHVESSVTTSPHLPLTDPGRIAPNGFGRSTRGEAIPEDDPLVPTLPEPLTPEMPLLPLLEPRQEATSTS